MNRGLDRYEGYPAFYYKRELELPVEGKNEQAMVYIMREENQMGLPSQRYYTVVGNAYRKFGFDRTVLEQALVMGAGRQLTGEDCKALVQRLRQEYPPVAGLNWCGCWICRLRRRQQWE